MTMTTVTMTRLDHSVTDAPSFAKTDLPHALTSVGEARAWLGKTITGWGVPGDTAENAVLLVSETATNALIHNAGIDAITITAAWWHGHLRVTVSDPDLQIPVPDLADDEHGRGLMIVSAMATRWGETKTRAGKIVWFELDAWGEQ
jgi:anti-sigma regulatory factor (Ser/Thr protein kinase)